MSGTCRQFILKLVDGTEHRVNFRFSGPPAAVIKIAGGAPNVPTGQTSPQISIRAVDGVGVGIANRDITFAVTQGGGSVAMASVRTDFLGFAIVPAWTMGPPGPQKLTATFVAVNGTFTLDLLTNSVP